MYIFLAIIFGIIPAFIARSKGRSFFAWYVYGVYLWLIALIHSIVIKPYEEYLVATGKETKCPYCAEYVKLEAKVCKNCRKELPKVSRKQYEEQKALAAKILKQKNEKANIIAFICLVVPIAITLIGMMVMMLTVRG